MRHIWHDIGTRTQARPISSATFQTSEKCPREFLETKWPNDRDKKAVPTRDTEHDSISVMNTGKPRVSPRDKSFPRACCAAVVAAPVCRHGRSASSIDEGETTSMQTSIDSTPAMRHTWLHLSKVRITLTLLWISVFSITCNTHACHSGLHSLSAPLLW